MMERRASTWGAILAMAGAAALVGCGGHVAGIGDDDSGPGSDSGVDSGPGIDTGPGFDSYIDSAYDVPCTTESPCVDSGGTCPVDQPPLGSPCIGSAYCTYGSKCGSVSVACVGGAWISEGGYDAGC